MNNQTALPMVYKKMANTGKKETTRTTTYCFRNEFRKER
jgi:hypothetical protein